MDKTPDSSFERRAQKRPHSPKDDSMASSADLELTESGNILDTDEKRNKLMRLLGGKKRKNETAASKWLERVRSRDDEVKVSTELENQFNESLTHKLSGASRRHIGIGFKQKSPSPPPTASSNNPPGDSSDSKFGIQNVCGDSRMGGPYTHPPGAQDTYRPNIVASLSNRANVPSLSGRGPMMNRHGYRPPVPYQGYGMGPRNMSAPRNYDYQTPYGIAGCVPPPPPNYGAGYAHPTPNAMYGKPQLPSPPGPSPAENNDQDQQRQRPKSKNAFYAQFKKAS